MPALMEQAVKHGLTLVEINDRVEVHKGKKVISFDKNRDRAVAKALERLEADRLRDLDKLPKDRSKPLTKEPLERLLKTAKPVMVGSPVNPDQDVARQGEHRQETASDRKSTVTNPTPPPSIIFADLIPDKGSYEDHEQVDGVALTTITHPDKVIKGSVVKSKYRERYKANGYSCGDFIAEELQAYVCKLVGNRMQVVADKLKEVAVANEIWEVRYENLNMGLQRMTIGNRLRHRYNEGIEINIGGCKFQQTYE